MLLQHNMLTLLILFVSSGLLLSVAAAGAVNATFRAALVCKELKASLGNAVQLPSDAEYEALSTINWYVCKISCSGSAILVP